MLSQRQFDNVEGIFELEPGPTYPERAAQSIAELVGAAGWKLVMTDGREVLRHAGAGEGLALPVRHARDAVGTLHLYATDGSARFGDDAQRLARWAVRLLSRGLAQAKSAESDTGGDREAAIAALLESTPLTPRERDVVGRLVGGASTRDIADVTGLTISTVNTYMKRIFAKLGVHSRVELLARVTGTHGAFRNAAE